MLGAHKIQVPEKYYPLGVKNEGRFYFNRKTRDFQRKRSSEKNFCESYGWGSPPPSESPSVVAWKNQKIFPRNLAFALQTSISSHGDNVVFVLTSCPMKEQKTLILLNGHLVTIDEYREWIEDQQR